MEDPVLVDYLRDNQSPLEVCPTSNVCIGVFPNFAAHPIRDMYDAGLNVTVNSDDPPMFSTSVNHEWERVVETFGFTVDEVKKMSLCAIDAALVSDQRREDIRRSVETVFADEAS